MKGIEPITLWTQTKYTETHIIHPAGHQVYFEGLSTPRRSKNTICAVNLRDNGLEPIP
jgi:hypothetical protein